MNEQIKALANELGKSILQQNQTPEYYIASPFFDERSKNWVTAKEKEFEGFRIPFFSPRQDGVNFNEEGLTPELRSERIKAIFLNNVRNLDVCTKICVNLLPCNGRLDIGTLWELGYFIAKHGNPFRKRSQNTLAVSEDLKDLIFNICSTLANLNSSVGKLAKAKDKEKFVLLYKNASATKITDSLALMNFSHISPIEINSVIGNFSPQLERKYIFLIDEFPFQLFILMGWMYANELPYYTASFKGYGSNVMIAASSEGHIQLPGLVDETYKTDLK